MFFKIRYTSEKFVHPEKTALVTHDFTLIVSGPDSHANDFEDRFYEAGCEDVTISFCRGRIEMNFARQADRIEDAIASAIRDVRKAGAMVENIKTM